MKRLYISIDKKYKTNSMIKNQIDYAIRESEKQTGETFEVVDSVEKAECAWFVDEWEDDIECFKEHEYCLKSNVEILHDKSEFWNRTRLS